MSWSGKHPEHDQGTHQGIPSENAGLRPEGRQEASELARSAEDLQDLPADEEQAEGDADPGLGRQADVPPLRRTVLRKGHPVVGASGKRPIQDAALGSRVAADGAWPGGRGPAQALDRDGWRAVSLVFTSRAGVRLHARLLRPVAWLARESVAVGHRLWLDLAHVGVRGEAVVAAIGPCPEIEEGPGCLVTGAFCFSEGRAYDLLVEGEAQPIRVTAAHPFWSVGP